MGEGASIAAASIRASSCGNSVQAITARKGNRTTRLMRALVGEGRGKGKQGVGLSCFCGAMGLVVSRLAKTALLAGAGLVANR